MKSRYILTMAGMMLTFALLTGCGAGPAGGNRTGENATDSGSAQREEELQAEIDSLREELDALKNAQGTQEASETDSSSSPDSENTQDQNSQNSNAAGQSGSGDAAQSQNSGDSSAVQNGDRHPQVHRSVWRKQCGSLLTGCRELQSRISPLSWRGMTDG